MKDISKKVTDLNVREPTPPDPFIALVERLSTNPDVDVQKLEKIVEVQMQVIKEQSRQAFNIDMVAVQKEIPTVLRDKENAQTSSQYASYEKIIDETKKIYTKKGFSVAFFEEDCEKPDHIRVAANLMHSAGHTEQYHVDIPLDKSGIKGTVNKTATHAKGSSMTYGRRYLLSMIFNIPTSDDDGNAAGIQLLNEAEVNKINDLIRELNVDKEKFLKYMKVNKIDEVAAKDFSKALSALEQKRKKGGKK